MGSTKNEKENRVLLKNYEWENKESKNYEAFKRSSILKEFENRISMTDFIGNLSVSKMILKGTRDGITSEILEIVKRK